MARKRGLPPEVGVDTLIRDTKGKGASSGTPRVRHSKTSAVQGLHTSEIPKFRSFEAKLSVLFREDQLEHLEILTRSIMRNRRPGKKEERITKNSILRAYVDALQDIKIETANIPNEEELLRRVKRALRAS